MVVTRVAISVMTPLVFERWLRSAYGDAAPGSLHRTANKSMLSENSPTLYCVTDRFWLMLFLNERGRRGTALRLRSMARQRCRRKYGQKRPASSPHGEAWGAFLLASKEGVYEYYSQENLADR
jgi:hypothetical protein